MKLKNFNQFIFEEDVKPAGSDELDDGSDKDLDKEIEDYLEIEDEYCPRCKERMEDCRCEDDDFWSTQTFHRVPKGEVTKSKPKQEFNKNENE
jgi:hypothetical protein